MELHQLRYMMGLFDEDVLSFLVLIEWKRESFTSLGARREIRAFPARVLFLPEKIKGSLSLLLCLVSLIYINFFA